MKNLIITMSFVALAGCATIFNSEPKMVNVNGTSTEDLVLTRNGMIMQRDIKLPQTLMIPNGWDDYALKNSKNDVCPIGSTVNGATFLNLIFGGLIGFGIDAATGDMVRAKGQAHCNI
ncbi:MAG: hypothetical protein LBF37_01140 [Rickettsiales bacterium]|jgi:hypothetical protein|nr:hypothetical protein [Rickettsiales bacterium]